MKAAGLVLVAFLGACASAPPDDGADYEVDVTAKPPPEESRDRQDGVKSPSPASTASSAAEVSPPDRAPAPAPVATDVVWEGKLAKTATVVFGGSPYCKYDVTFSNVEVSLTLDAIGRAKESRVTGTMTERSLEGCSHEGIPAHLHEYTWAATGEPPAKLDLTLLPGSKNKPPADLLLTGTPGADAMPVKLRLHRTDQTGVLAWTVPATLSLKRK